MLELRACCEHCNKSLPSDATDAMICSFECTFCRDCVQTVLDNVCPNCGGGFAPRPIRPQADLKGGNHLGKYPASGRAVYRPVDVQSHRVFAAGIKDIPPRQR